MEDTPAAKGDASEMQAPLQAVIYVSSQSSSNAKRHNPRIDPHGVEASQLRMACRDMLRTGSPQALCYAAVVMMPQLNGNGALDLFTRNYVFKAGFWAWLSAQTLKVVPSGHVIFCICLWLCICNIPWQNMQHIT